MNLRQKVKRAKKELAAAEKLHTGSTLSASVRRFLAKNDLQKIVDYKKKPTDFYNWDAAYAIDPAKLTHIGLHADFNELHRLHSPVGKPLTQEQIKSFLDECPLKIGQFAKRVHQRPPSDTRYVCYWLSISNDRTKRKSIHQEKLYKQFEGDNRIYPYEK